MAQADCRTSLTGETSLTGAGATRRASPARWASILLPNLASMLAMVTLVYCLFVFGGGEQFFRDSDTGWHIRSGQWILAHRALPRTDPYSFSKSGEPWFLWEWGSDVLIALAHSVDGLRGVTALVALAITACTWLWCRLNFAAGGDFFLAAALAPLMITTASLHWLARPHVFSWLFLLGFLLYLERPAARFSLVQLTAVAGVAALWANMHGSFLLAPLIALIYAVAHLIRPILWPADTGAERQRARWYFSIALAAMAGSMLNPYGWRLHAHVLSYLRNDELTSRIAEFQSFNFHDRDATQVAMTLAVAAAGGVLALSQRRLAHFFLAAGFVWAGLRSARVLPIIALAILPLANGVITEALQKVRSLRAPLRRSIDAALGYSSRLRAIDQRQTGVVFSAAVILLCLLALRAPALSKNIGFSTARYPVFAAAAIEKLPAAARVVAPDSFGGYLIYRFNGTRKVFTDGRSDFYSVDFMKQYLVLMSARPGWREIIHTFGFTHALLPNESALKAALEQAGWTTIAKDNIATLLEAH